MTDQVKVKERKRSSSRWLQGLSVVAILGAAAIGWYGQYGRPASTPVSAGQPGGTPEPVAQHPGAVTVVYNAAITPQFTRSAARPEIPVVRAGVPTVLRFGLGARWASSDLPPVPPNPSITASATDVPLTVMLACSFCEAPRSSQGTLVYRPKDRTSNVIEIPLLPSPTQAGDGLLEISLFDDRSGAEYDRLVIDVSVSNAAGLEPVQRNLALPSAGARAGSSKPAEPAADVILDVAADSTGSGVVTVKVTPLDPGLSAALAPLALQSDGRWRTFKTALVDQEQIRRVTTTAHGEVTALVKQGPFLAVLRRLGWGVELPKDVQGKKPFDDQQRDQVVRLFAKHGQNLYAELFENGHNGPMLAPVIAEVERFAGAAPYDRPLRMLVRSARVALPWQYLHPSGDINADRFWGMRFSLAVQRVNTGRRHHGLPAAGGRTVAYLKVAAAVDDTADFARQQIGQLKALAHDPLVIDSRKALLAAFKDRGRDIAAVITFLHASSGHELVLATNELRVAERATGPEIQFSPADAVDTSTLENLSNSLPPTERPVLAAGPLVILNACESGPSTIALPHVNLEDAMLRLGARGVIVTEAVVWIPFGHEVATRLIDRLGKGEPVASAVTQVRRELLKERNNPLTLLYAYHGDPSLSLPQR